MTTHTLRLRRAIFVVLITTVASCSCITIADADSFGPPRPGIFASSNAKFGFKTLPKHAIGILFTIDDDGREQVVWKKLLANIPVRVLVAPSGKRVVTVDTYADMGREHSLVVYDENGTTIADYHLEELLSEQEIRDKVVTTSPNRWWTSGALFKFRHDGGEPFRHLDITLQWGKVITIQLNTGRIHEQSKKAENTSTQ